MSENILRDKFIKADNDKFINPLFVRWIKKADECFYICSKMDGCYDHQTHKVCKSNNSTSYGKLLKMFKEETD